MFYKVAPSNLQMGFQAPSPWVISIMKYFKTNFAISQKHLEINCNMKSICPYMFYDSMVLTFPFYPGGRPENRAKDLGQRGSAVPGRWGATGPAAGWAPSRWVWQFGNGFGWPSYWMANNGGFMGKPIILWDDSGI
jgi:hypothetical protein